METNLLEKAYKVTFDPLRNEVNIGIWDGFVYIENKMIHLFSPNKLYLYSEFISGTQNGVIYKYLLTEGEAILAARNIIQSKIDEFQDNVTKLQAQYFNLNKGVENEN